MNVSVVIPTYNEEETIGKLLDAIFALKTPHEISVVVVDDNSQDNTANIVKNQALSKPVFLLQRPGKMGIGSAYIAGFTQALRSNPDAVMQMDADLSHDPQDVPRLVKALAYADVSIGSRKVKGGSIIGWGPIRYVMSHGAMIVARTLLDLKTKDVTAGFRAIRSHVLSKVSYDTIKSNGYAFQEELLYRIESSGFTIKEISVTFEDRKHGSSKLGRKEIIEFFLRMIQLAAMRLKK